MIEKITVVPGIAMPFFPMRPMTGRPLRTRKEARELFEELESNKWVCQPKLNEDRACLGVADGRILVQNRHGSWYKFKVKNAFDFLKLPNLTVLDGGVYDGNFYPFEVIAMHGKNLCGQAASEREVLAFQCSRLLGHPWLFNRPNKTWLQRLHKNLPKWEGVVLKRQESPYIILGSDTQVSPHWRKRRWA